MEAAAEYRAELTENNIFGKKWQTKDGGERYVRETELTALGWSVMVPFKVAFFYLPTRKDDAVILAAKSGL